MGFEFSYVLKFFKNINARLHAIFELIFFTQMDLYSIILGTY